MKVIFLAFYEDFYRIFFRAVLNKFESYELFGLLEAFLQVHRAENITDTTEPIFPVL